MFQSVCQMLSEFDNLPAEEQHNFFIQILRRTGNLPDGALEDDGLTLIADQLFQALDEEENNDASTNSW